MSILNLKLERSVMCLETSPLAGLNIPPRLSFAFNQIFQSLLGETKWRGSNTTIADSFGIGVFNQTKADSNTDPCLNPDFRKIKLGSGHVRLMNQESS